MKLKKCVIIVCLMLILTIIPLVQADGEFTIDTIEKEYFEVYDIADFGQCARGVTTADFNDDGYMDFAVSYSTQPFEYSTHIQYEKDGQLHLAHGHYFVELDDARKDFSERVI